MDSILKSISKMLGINEDDTYFDMDLIVHINSILSVLSHEGIGKGNFMITGSDETWSQFLGDLTDFEMIKQYVFMKVKLVFDPPTNSAVMEVYNNTIAELEWRMYSKTNYEQEDQNE